MNASNDLLDINQLFNYKYTTTNFNECILREMTKEDFDIITRWAIEEHWNPVVEQIKPFFAQDTSCYQVLELHGQLVAGIFIYNYSTEFGFLGHFIVNKDFRHKGYGQLLLKHTLAKCSAVKTIGLNGVISQIDYYQSHGFSPTFYSSRWQGCFSDKIRSLNTTNTHNEIIITDEHALTHILQYERNTFPFSREQFITEWQTMNSSYSIAALIDDIVVGYCVITSCHEGLKIAPLYANNIDIAIKLYQAVAKKYNGKTFYIDMPQVTQNTSDLVKLLGLEKIFETQRMYTHGEPTPAIDYTKIYGYTTFEFGL